MFGFVTKQKGKGSQTSKEPLPKKPGQVKKVTVATIEFRLHKQFIKHLVKHHKVQKDVHFANKPSRRRGQRSERNKDKRVVRSCVQSCTYAAIKNTNGSYVQDKALSATQKSAYLK